MQPFRHHVFVCEQSKPEGVPCCSARGAAQTLAALRREIATRGLLDEVQVTACGSIGLCERGPNMVVYPEGVWYSGVTAADVPELVQGQFVEGKPVERLLNRDVDVLGAEIRANRDRAMAALRAREAAGVMPDDLVQTIRAYQESRIVLTAIELDVFTVAADGRTAREVAGAVGSDARAAELLLDALVAMGLLRKSSGRFSTTPVTERFLSARGDADTRMAMLHHSSLWPLWAKLTDAVREGSCGCFEELGERDDTWTRPFIAAMHRNATERARIVVPAVGTAGVTRMLDVGGGSGAYSIAFARASESLRAEIVDLETVLPIARSHVEAAGLSDRVSARAGDLRTDSFGTGYDLVFVSAICHAFDEPQNQDLVARCAAALARGGRLVIHDFVLDEDRTSPRTAALFSINMLVGMPGGRSYAESEYVAWLENAGLADARRVSLPGPTDLIVGTKT